MLPFDLWESTFLVEGFQQTFTSQELLTLCIWQIECRDEDVTRAMQILWNSRLASKHQFEKHFEICLAYGSYSPGDLVLVRNTAMEKELNRKIKPRYLRPYKVARQNLGHNYILEELGTSIHYSQSSRTVRHPKCNHRHREWADHHRRGVRFQVKPH